MNKGFKPLALISRNGMSKLFSSLESKPSSLAACLKFLLVAAKAFIVSRTRSSETQKGDSETQRSEIIRTPKPNGG